MFFLKTQYFNLKLSNSFGKQTLLSHLEIELRFKYSVPVSMARLYGNGGGASGSVTPGLSSNYCFLAGGPGSPHFSESACVIELV